jgi:hypothetical protein
VKHWSLWNINGWRSGAVFTSSCFWQYIHLDALANVIDWVHNVPSCPTSIDTPKRIIHTSHTEWSHELWARIGIAGAVR